MYTTALSEIDGRQEQARCRSGPREFQIQFSSGTLVLKTGFLPGCDWPAHDSMTSSMLSRVLLVPVLPWRPCARGPCREGGTFSARHRGRGPLGPSVFLLRCATADCCESASQRTAAGDGTPICSRRCSRGRDKRPWSPWRARGLRKADINRTCPLTPVSVAGFSRAQVTVGDRFVRTGSTLLTINA